MAHALDGRLSASRFASVVRPFDEEMDAAAIDDGVVGAAHRLDEIGNRRRDRRRARAVENVLEREVQGMSLVDRDLKNAGGDLHSAGEAPGRRVQDREAGRDDAAALRQLSRSRQAGGPYRLR